MYTCINNKIKECEDFLVHCEQWKRECEDQLCDVNALIHQNKSMIRTFRHIVTKKCDKKQIQHTLLPSELPTTPPTPLTPINHYDSDDDLNTQGNMLLESSLSPILFSEKECEFETPKKVTINEKHNKIHDIDDNNSLIKTNIDDNSDKNDADENLSYKKNMIKRRKKMYQ